MESSRRFCFDYSFDGVKVVTLAVDDVKDISAVLESLQIVYEHAVATLKGHQERETQEVSTAPQSTPVCPKKETKRAKRRNRGRKSSEIRVYRKEGMVDVYCEEFRLRMIGDCDYAPKGMFIQSSLGPEVIGVHVLSNGSLELMTRGKDSNGGPCVIRDHVVPKKFVKHVFAYLKEHRGLKRWLGPRDTHSWV